MTLRLEALRIASSCSADWNDMRGDAQVRFCGQCDKHVYNLSAMTRADAEALLGAREGRLCVRLYRRVDGTVLTSDCPVGARNLRVRRRVWCAVSGATASLALLVSLVAGRAHADLAVAKGKPATTVGNGVKLPPRPQPLMGAPPAHIKMGDVAVMPEPPPPPADKK